MSTTEPAHPPGPAPAGVAAVGLVVTVGRPLARTPLHGEPLVAHAARALAGAGVQPVEPGAPWAALQRLDLPLVLHDPLCPLTPAAFVAEAVAAAVPRDTGPTAAVGAGGEVRQLVVAGCRAVTDTIKTVTGGLVGETVDRDSLVTVTSPMVLSAEAVRSLEDWPDTTDFAELVTELRARFRVDFLEAPSLGRRVEDESAVLLLEAYEEEHGVGHGS